MAMKWNKLKDVKPEGPGPFLYFPVKVSLGHAVQISNGDYLRGRYCLMEVDGIDTVWAEIDLPDEWDKFDSARYLWED